MARTPKCLIPGCKNKAKTRGLCMACYMAARRQMASGAVDEEALVKKGLLLPACRGTKSLFRQAAEKAGVL